MLQTEYLAYISSSMVDTLANQLLVKTSPFYQIAPPYNQLSAHVLSTFPVAGASDNSGSSSGTDGSNNSASSGSSSNKTRENAIIGVISSLGAITLLVLAFLAIRAFKQRRALAHRRLSDPPQDPNAFVGARPDNQEFDRDTLGDQRRRSFYYAEDSLRVHEGSTDVGAAAAANFDQRTTDLGMRERRPVNAAMISTPVLRDNTMNW